MLPWQPKKHKQQSVLAQLFFCTAVVHGALLLPVFFIKQGPTAYHIQISNTAAKNLPVIFVPSSNASSAQHKSPTIQKSLRSIEKAVKKKVTKQKTKPKLPLKTVVAAPKKLVVATKKIETSEKKKVTEKKIEQEKIKPQTPDKIAQVEPPLAQTQEPPQESAASQARYVTANELEQLAIENYLKEELGTRWKPPQGLNKDLSCQIKLDVAADGSIGSIGVVNSSGVLLYDLAAEDLFINLKMLPEFARGKVFYITFKQ